MPNAAPDPDSRARFIADHEALLTSVGLQADAAVGVALSGGPDSVALLLLASSCATGRVRAMTVDHGLRPAASAEADAAAALCRTLDIPHEIARVEVGAGSVQAAAREARYAALAEWAARERLDAILTAHHADDQAETLLMRLARGSGLAGLAGIRAGRRLAGVSPYAGDDETGPMLLRPLLRWRKTELEAIVAAAGIVPARDPSNHDPRYDRTQARALLASAGWLDPVRVAAAADHLAEAEAALDAIAMRHAATALGEDGGDIILAPAGIAEIDRRLLRHLLCERFAKSADGPAIERALAALSRGEPTTCADILCRPKGGLWRFRRAPPRQRSKRSA